MHHYFAIATRYRRSILTAALFGVAVVGAASTHADEALQWDVTPGESVALRRGPQVVWQLQYDASAQAKPFFHPVAVDGGPVLTWNSPPDHRWHHGLWFCWKYINGVNYWEPAPGSHLPAGRTLWSDVHIARHDDHSASITMDLTYRDPDGTEVLTEVRRVDISAPQADGGYHLDWHCQFTAGPNEVVLDRTPLPDEPDGKAWGGYAGLSARLAEGMSDRRAVTPDGPVELNDQSRYRGKARALDYTGRLDDQVAGIAMLDHPKNLNYPTPWYVIVARPMSYFSPAVICYAPHRMAPGSELTLRYRVLVHTGRLTPQQLDDAQKAFAER